MARNWGKRKRGWETREFRGVWGCFLLSPGLQFCLFRAKCWVRCLRCWQSVLAAAAANRSEHTRCVRSAQSIGAGAHLKDLWQKHSKLSRATCTASEMQNDFEQGARCPLFCMGTDKRRLA